MKHKIEHKYFAWGFTAFLTVCACSLVIYLIFNFSAFLGFFGKISKILASIIDGIAIAYLLTPILNFIESKWIGPLYKKSHKELTQKHKKSRRRWSIFVTMILVIAVIYLFMSIVIPQIILSIQSIIIQLPIYINNLGDLVTKLLENNPDLETTVDSLYDTYSEEALSYIQNSILPQINDIIKTLYSGVFGFIKGTFNLIVGLIISIYLMMSKEVLAGQAKKIVYSYYETKSANKIIAGIRYTHRTFIGFVGGKIIDSIIIGILTFIVTNIVGTPYAVLVSVIIGVTNIIPFFGPFIGAIPSALLILMVDPLQALYFVIIIFIIQQIDGNIIGPKILGDSTGLSSFWVIFSITLFGGIFGVAGMIIGVPTFAVLYALLRYQVNRRLRRKNLPSDTVPYINLGSIEPDGTFMEYVPIKGRTILQILGIQKMDVVKREIIVDDDNVDTGSEEIAFTPGDVNVVSEDEIESLQNENMKSNIKAAIAESIAGRLFNSVKSNNDITNDDNNGTNDDSAEKEDPDGADE